MKKKFNNNGFTLIELLAVIVVLAIILTIAIPAVTGSLNESKNNTAMIQAQKAAKGMKECYMSASLGTSNANDATIKGSCASTAGATTTKLNGFLDKSITENGAGNKYFYSSTANSDEVIACVKYNNVTAYSNGTKSIADGTNACVASYSAAATKLGVSGN